LLAGEKKHIEVLCPDRGAHCVRIALRGWNVVNQEVDVRGGEP
jgi:hypothetical protein